MMRRRKPGTVLKRTLSGSSGVTLAERLGMVSLIPPATFSRASVAYLAERDYLAAVDAPRTYRRNGTDRLLVEESATRLDPAGGDITASPFIAANSVLTDEGDGVYGAYLPSMSNTFFYLYSGSALSAASHTLRFQWRKTPGSTETGTLTVQGQDASNAGPTYVAAQTPPDSWEWVSATVSEPGTSIRLAFFDSGGVDFQIRFCQFEQSPYPTSWIPGPGTTRAADDAFTTPFTANSGAILFAFRRPYPPATGEHFRLIESSGGGSDLLISVSTVGEVVARIEGSSVGAASAALTLTDWNTYTYAWDNGQAATYVNGVLLSSVAAADPVGSATVQLYGGPPADRYLNGLGTAYEGRGRAYPASEIAAISDDLLARLAA